MAKRPEKIPVDDVSAESLTTGLSYQDLHRVLANVLWDVFGDVDDDGRSWLVPDRDPEDVDVESLVASLRQEFWPEEDEEEDDDDGEET